MKIEIVNDNIFEVDVQAIVNPANSYGYMGGGLALELRELCGQEVEDEIVHHAPIPIGHAVITSGGSQQFQIIHSPTMEQPAGYTDIEIVRQATFAALVCAEENDLESIAFPGMGTGVGGLDKKEAAKAMFEVILNFKVQSVKKIMLCAINDELFSAFEEVFGQSTWKHR